MSKRVRSRGYTITINNFTLEDDLELYDLLTDPLVGYGICGYEGLHDKSIVHAHIHVYVHYPNPVSPSYIKKWFTKQHHIESVASPMLMIQYCKGYDKGQLKEPLCGENLFHEIGIPPANGVNTTSKMVIDYIKEGHTIDEVSGVFPAFDLYHHEKLVDFYSRQKVVDKTPTVFVHYIGNVYSLIISDYPTVQFFESYDQLVNATSDVVCLRLSQFSEPPELFRAEIGEPLLIKSGYKWVSKKFSTILIWKYKYE